jgi:hypothetical protein
VPAVSSGLEIGAAPNPALPQSRATFRHVFALLAILLGTDGCTIHLEASHAAVGGYGFAWSTFGISAVILALRAVYTRHRAGSSVQLLAFVGGMIRAARVVFSLWRRSRFATQNIRACTAADPNLIIGDRSGASTSSNPSIWAIATNSTVFGLSPKNPAASFRRYQAPTYPPRRHSCTRTGPLSNRCLVSGQQKAPQPTTSQLPCFLSLTAWSPRPDTRTVRSRINANESRPRGLSEVVRPNDLRRPNRGERPVQIRQMSGRQRLTAACGAFDADALRPAVA